MLFDLFIYSLFFLSIKFLSLSLSFSILFPFFLYSFHWFLLSFLYSDMDQLSGGEKTMAALGLLFSIHRFCNISARICFQIRDMIIVPFFIFRILDSHNNIILNLKTYLNLILFIKIILFLFL